MKRKYRLSALSLVSVLTGCATGYHPLGSFAAGGYSEIDGATPDRVTVAFDADAWTKAQSAWDYALLRAGEVCQQRGYSYLAVTNQEGGVMAISEDFPGHPWMGRRAEGFTSSETIEVDEPHVKLEVQFYREKPKNDTDTPAASEIITELRNKYRL